jgi:beta-aspartyl-peptidase (threonine type)
MSRRGWGGCTDLRRFLSVLVLVSGFSPLIGCRFQRHETRASAVSEEAAADPSSVIPEMLQASAASWNAGDLDGFMDDYWVSEELTFSGATGVTRGWQNVRERYLQTYWASDAIRDSLRFEDIEVKVLGVDHALALGRYVLYQPEEVDEAVSSGFFTLVLRQTDGEWKIVHDHTSATPEEEGREGNGG